MPKKVLITSALLYANGKMHPGHLVGAYLPADCYARFERLQGSDVHFVSGSDEYGVAITLSAELAKKTPKEHVDHFHQINQKLFERLNFSFDIYSRTTWPGHDETVVAFFQDLLDNGHIEKKSSSMLFSQEENRFLADRYVVGTCPKCGYEQARGDECPKCSSAFDASDLKDPRSKLTGSSLQLKETTHWFLRFDHFKEKLQEFLKTKNWKPNVVHFVENYINDLKERAITRDLDWGIPVPLEEAQGKVLYVWFDAPIGYISASKQCSQEKNQPDLWKDYWLDPNCELVHFIGKDNIPFHAVFFPAMCMGQNTPYKLVDQLPANEFLNLEGKQFSKSDNWMIDLDEMLDRFSVDQIRYALCANAPETSDSEFTWKDFQQKCNGDLLGKYGNLVNRVLVFCEKFSHKRVPNFELHAEDKELIEQSVIIVDKIQTAYSQFQLRKASQLIMELASLGNAYFDQKKPWVDAKSPETTLRMETTLYCCLQILQKLALVSFPIMPKTAQTVWEMIGTSTPLTEQSWSSALETGLEPGQLLHPQGHLFAKIEDETITQQINQLHNMENTQDTPKEETSSLIDIDHFFKTKLQVGKVLSAEKVEKSKKLLLLKVELGEDDVRQVVSGIALHYKPEDLINRHVIVVANLKPAKLMGIESQGMILATDTPDGLEVAFVDQLPVGSVLS